MRLEPSDAEGLQDAVDNESLVRGQGVDIEPESGRDPTEPYDPQSREAAALEPRDRALVDLGSLFQFDLRPAMREACPPYDSSELLERLAICRRHVRDPIWHA